MRLRHATAVNFACACALFLAGTVRAADSTEVASPDTTAAKAEASETKPAPAKPAAPAASAAVTATDAAIKAIDAQIAKAAVNKKDPSWRTRLPMPTVVKFNPARTYSALMTTSKGDVVIKFLPGVAPMHVTNFIYLARLGFYDGIAFHRVIPDFMAQGGCPVGNGTGGPGYGFGGEFSPNLRHSKPGLLSMANTGQPNSDGSQFFLTFVATPWLDGKHTIFGEVTSGMDVVKAIEAKGSQQGTPTERMVMTKVRIEVK